MLSNQSQDHIYDPVLLLNLINNYNIGYKCDLEDWLESNKSLKRLENSVDLLKFYFLVKFFRWNPVE